MEGSRFIKSLQLENFLSYGSKSEEIELKPLNVLIGANASGKSNLIEAIALLKATPTDLPAPIRQGGGINDFLWKGDKKTPVARIKATINYPQANQDLNYQLSLTVAGQKLELVDEAVENQIPYDEEEDVYFYYRYLRGHPVLNVKREDEEQRIKRFLRREDLMVDQSVLSQRKDPDLYPELSF
ncbi:AAA family ATPase [Calothrix rhizosoleniae]|uniref:AAA family ATPase n=1 Tax=Calothrix rhizosoleniae TaxID=888997 RepID=UPI001F3E78DA|nr:AAA family ATPase [Calothrix rhizosoleniae]